MKTIYPIHIRNFNFLFKNNIGKLNSCSLINSRNNKKFNQSKIKNKTYMNQMTQTTRNNNLTTNDFAFLTFLKDNRENNFLPIKEKSFNLPKIRIKEENLKMKISKVHLKLDFNCKTLRENKIRNKFLSLIKDVSFQKNQIGNLIYNEIYENKKSKSIKKRNNDFNISFKNSFIQNSLKKSNSCRLIKKFKIKY